jgi:hypothetical protein
MVMVHSFNALIDLAFCVMSMTTASNQKVENIQMKEGDESSFEPRVHPPPTTSKEDKDTYKEKFKKMDLVIKFTGKNNGGIPDAKKSDWDAANKDLQEAIDTPTYNGPFFVMLDMLVSNVEVGSMIGICFEGDNNDCTWTQALLKAFQYLSEKGYNVHVFVVKAYPSKLLINKKFFDSWRNAVKPALFETNWHFLIVGDDNKPETKMFKEIWTNNVAHIIVNFLSIRFHWNAAGDKFNAGARLMLEMAGLTATTDATIEKIYTDWDTDKTDDMQAFITHVAEKGSPLIKLESSLNGLFNAVYRI